MLRPIVITGDRPEIHRARWLALHSQSLIENGCVQVHGGIITHAGPFRKALDGQVTDHGPGLLMPALVNAHTHLELSALSGQLSVEGGFEAWVRRLLTLRDKIGQDALIEGVETGRRELMTSGTRVVGDVSTLDIVADPLRNSGLSGILFREYLGSTLPAWEALDDPGLLRRSLAGHAPHTSAPDLLVALKKRCRDANRPFSIHLAESSDEMEFLTQGRGNWAEFLSSRGIDFSDWGLPSSSPVRHLDRLGLLDSQTLCVHVLRADDQDLDILSRARAPVCLCPRSNVLLHQRLPDVEAMIKRGLCLCLGTDSLAVTPTLNLVDDMAFLADQVAGIAPWEIVRMATENGARALGLDRFYGRLEPGMVGAMCYAEVSCAPPRNLFESMLHE